MFTHVADYPKVFTRNGAQCVFPFKYKDELYFGCTSLNIPLRKTRVNTKYPGKKWCQTVYEVKSSLEIPAQGGDDQDSTWGYCQNSKNLSKYYFPTGLIIIMFLYE